MNLTVCSLAFGSKMPVRVIVLGPKICIKVNQIKILNEINNLYSVFHKYNLCNME